MFVVAAGPCLAAVEARFFKAVNVRDVRMVQRRQDLRFPLEPREAIGIIGERLRQNFQCDIATEPRVPRLVDLAHAARADWREDLIGTEAGAAGERHYFVGTRASDNGYTTLDAGSYYRQPTRSVRSFAFAAAIVCHCMLLGASAPPQARGRM